LRGRVPRRGRLGRWRGLWRGLVRNAGFAVLAHAVSRLKCGVWEGGRERGETNAS